MHTSKLTVAKFALTLAFALGAGTVIGACGIQKKIDLTCMKYCDKAAQCNPDTDAQDCTENCIAALNLCSDAEKKEALVQLKECGRESCDDLVSCSISAGAQCVFGLDL